MSNKKAILIYQAIGFIFLIICCWIEELVDVNHILFNYAPQTGSIAEAIEETIIILIVAAVILTLNYRLLHRIRVLEGIVPTCSFCKKVRVSEKWQPIELYLRKNADVQLSHGFCPECMEKNYGEYVKKFKDIKK